MKRIGIFSIFLLFLFIIIPNTYAAVTQEECDAAVSPETCPAGCGYNPELDVCEQCPVGFYKSEIGAQQCTPCTIKPSNTNFTVDDANKGMTEDMCPWEIICNAGQYFDGSQCLACGDYYLTNNYECPILGTGATITTEDYANCTHAARCDGKVYTLDLRHNSGLTWFEDKTAYFKYGSGFSANETGPWNKSTLPPEAMQEDNPPGQEFVGYFNGRDGIVSPDREQYFDNEGGYTRKTYADLADLANKDNVITLYAAWSYKPYYIHYYYDNTGNDDPITQNCGGGKDFTVEDCTTMGYPPGNSGWQAPEGTSFVEYECYKTYTDGEFSNPCGTYIPGVQINPPEGKNEDTLYFVAQYQVCPIGHYCDSNGQHECPGGTTTTSTGTSSISDCVMRRGVSGTKFCDSTGNCFYIPNSLLYSGAIPGR